MEPELTQNVFGLDISQQALRVVQLKKRGKKLLLRSYGEATVPAGTIVNGEIVQADQLVTALGKLLKSAHGEKITTRNVITVLPEQRTFIKVISVTLDPALPAIEAIKEEARKHIPLNLDETYLDWQVVRQQTQTAAVLVGVAPQPIVDSYLSTVEQAGLTVHALEIEAAAITRSLITKRQAQPRIIIDFGAVRTGLIIHNGESIQFTASLPISGHQITTTIAETLKLDYAKAEEAKIVCGLDPTKCEGALRKVLSSALNNLVSQIKKSVAFYQMNFPNQPPMNEIILCGGGANFLKIDTVLAEKLGIPVTIGAPNVHLTSGVRVVIPKQQLLSYTTAVGLALRPFQKGLL